MATIFTAQQLQSVRDRFISADGAVNLPVEIKRFIDVSAAGKSAASYKVRRVVDFTVALAGVCILLGRKDEAERVMRTGFEFVNGTMTHAENQLEWPKPEYWGCMCDIADRFGMVAETLGLPEVTKYVYRVAHCPDSPCGFSLKGPYPFREVPPEETQECAQYWAEQLLNWSWPELH